MMSLFNVDKAKLLQKAVSAVEMSIIFIYF